MSQDFIYIFWWWTTLFVIGVVNIPLCWLVFKKFVDLGYGFAKVIGSLLITYAIFLLGTFHVLPLTNFALLLIFLSCLALNFYIFSKNKKAIHSQILKNIRIVIAQEILFTIGLLLWSYVRTHQPNINGLEKFMDFGFINSVLRSKYLPPTDMWFAGLPINYYWFGHLWVAVITKLSKLPSSVTYNLMLATIMGMGLTSAFSIVSTLVKTLKPKLNKKVIYLAGTISAILLIFAGNFHTPYYLWKNGRDKYWYPDATRFIGYNPETEDKTIHEFPIYSFVVSDLHAHLINFPFVLLYIALLFNYLLKRHPELAEGSDLKKKKQILKQVQNDRKSNLALKLPNILPLGFLLGVFFMTSTWDFGNYFLTTGVALSVFHFYDLKINFKKVVSITKTLLLIFGVAMSTVLPFILNFESIAQGVKLVHTHTPLWQLAILWGFPAIFTVIFTKKIKSVWPKVKSPDLFVASLFISSWILILLPEIFYVKDIYIASHYRANTMFKLTYQAYVMTYLSSGYVAIRSIMLAKERVAKIILIAFYLLLFASILMYPKIATESYYNKLKNYQGLNGTSWVAASHPDLSEAINWFNKNVDGQPVILEASGDSYTEFNVVSSYTGLPTVSGWFVHEWLWRGDSSFPQARVNDIIQIYTSADINYTKSLLEKHNVKYVIIGEFEYQRYPNLNESKFDQLGNIAFTSGNTKVYRLK